MRVLVSSTHSFPALTETGSGLEPKPFPSGSGYLVHDLMVRGLAELGHQVSYLVPHTPGDHPTSGVTLVSEPNYEADILHTISDRDEELVREWQSRRKPWVTTCHLDPRARGNERPPSTENWIFVSRTLAQLHGRDRYVLNGIDPAEYIFSEVKDDYLLFMSTMDWGFSKGLDVALSLSAQLGFRLVIAGTGRDRESIEKVADMGRKVGACPEIISPDVGFVCHDEQDYVRAISQIGAISPQVCRDKAMNKYHYLRMAADYTVEYEKEIARNGN